MSDEVKEECNNSSFFWGFILVALIFGFENQKWDRYDKIKGEDKND